MGLSFSVSHSQMSDIRGLTYGNNKKKGYPAVMIRPAGYPFY